MNQRKFLWLGLVAMGLDGCSDNGMPPEAYRRSRDRIIARLGEFGFIFGYPCVNKRGSIYVPIGDLECYQYDAPRRFKGVWLYEFEGSRFIESASAPPRREVDPSYGTWLDFNPNHIVPDVEFNRYDVRLAKYPTQAFAIEFIGRRTAYRGSYGHLGAWGYDIKVDRIISAKQLRTRVHNGS